MGARAGMSWWGEGILMFGVSPLYGCPGPTSEATATAGLNELRAVSLELRVKQRQEQRQRQEQEQEQEQEQKNKQIPCGNDKQKKTHAAIVRGC